MFRPSRTGKLLRLTLPDESPSGAQGFFLNTRRPKLADVRVRKALDYVFDFELANKTIFYELYTRTESFFENSAMKATGKPSAEELALLEPFKASLPPEVFDEPYRPPVSDGSGKDRKLLQAADKLLNEAGWTVKNGARVNAKGEVFDLEFLIVDPVSERVLSNYVENLKRLGLAISIRRVDPAQYQRRVKSFDFDVVTARYSLRLTPGVELRSYWGSETAKMDGSLNLAGISSPAIDALIGKVGGGQVPRGARGCHTRPGSGAARRPLLGAPMVQTDPPYRPLGQVLAAGHETALRSGNCRHLVVRCGQG